tara:strand:+ start:467 stop:610 length:144 start_codon:yes stop_codon:yes gene_type:complete
VLLVKNINHYIDTTKEKIENLKFIAEIAETNKEKKIIDIGNSNLFIN